ncbi:class I SAM-dependent methyltransferase [Pseudorhodoplanes sp.]|uniref:class I SAM-dependent methyltransferase n=1 Tax=Pseudorhodoplanes sp. TaxID=1934341 RepID=UPI00391D4925
MMRRTVQVSAFAAIAVLLATAPLAAQNQAGQGGHHHHPRFDDPKKWSERFDNPERDKWQMPDRIVSSLALRKADSVADIGAGTGYMAVRLARAVPEGLVFAVDIEPNMVKHLAGRAKSEALGNLRAVKGSATSPNLPEPVDVAFLLNTYHHIDNRTGYFKRLRNSLKPGGRVAIVDYRPDAPAGPPKHMRLPAAQITAEMAAAGYKPAASFDFLPRQSFLIFEVVQ